MYSASGRSGLATVTFCAGAAGSPGTNWGGFCTDPSKGVGVNGLARYTKTTNQFGGTTTGRVLGTAKVYFNKDGLALINLPCTGCQFQLSEVIPQSTGVGGGAFGGTAMNPAYPDCHGRLHGHDWVQRHDHRLRQYRHPGWWHNTHHSQRKRNLLHGSGGYECWLSEHDRHAHDFRDGGSSG